jgi:hypothetical protein
MQTFPQVLTMPQVIDLESEKAMRAAQESELLRKDIISKCAATIEAMGGDVAGFALIVWNGSGEMRTVYDASKGPVGPALLPTLASDALNRHVAVMLARDADMDDTSAN